MKKIGREVLFLTASDENPRMGEGAFLRLKDGRIMYAYSKFIGDMHDHAVADIVALYSADEGETWGGERTIVFHCDQARNRMCPNLVRLNDGGIGLMHGKKLDATLHNNPHFIRSYDEGLTWSEPVICTKQQDQYYVKENDHLLKTVAGRLIMPLNHHPLQKDKNGNPITTSHSTLFFIASDDNGATWYDLCEEFDLPYPEISQTGLQETTVYEQKDGTLRAFSRTDLLCQYECSSSDGGKTWSMPVPNPFFSSPASPMLIKSVGDMVVAAFNPIPNYTTRSLDPDGRPTANFWSTSTWGRTPIVLAVSKDDGKTFPKVFYLEDDMSNAYCYPAIFDGGDYLLVSYYHANNSGFPLSSCKMIKIPFSELAD